MAPGICVVLGRTRQRGQFFSHAGDHLVSADLALAKRLQDDEHTALVLGPVAAYEGHHALNAGVRLYDADEFVCLAFHCVKGEVLVAHHHATEAASVLLWKEALGHNDVQSDIHHDHQDGDNQN